MDNLDQSAEQEVFDVLIQEESRSEGGASEPRSITGKRASSKT